MFGAAYLIGGQARPARETRVARYIRVSTRDQRPELQSDETQRLIDARGWRLVDTYLDQGISGSKTTRPELTRMLNDARKGRFDVLLAWKSDRLFRSLRHMVITLEELAAIGVDFVSVTEPFDSTTPQGRLLMHIVSAMGEFERDLIRERTMAGLAAAKRRGAPIGRPRVAVDLVKVGVLMQTMSMRQTAKELGVSREALRRALAKPSNSDQT
jgi:DNA invertase Pin-like site-specific DNA recombinase